MKTLAENASDFADLRTLDNGDCIYVDKTDYFHRLVTAPGARLFFIARHAAVRRGHGSAGEVGRRAYGIILIVKPVGAELVRCVGKAAWCVPCPGTGGIFGIIPALGDLS